MSSVFTYALVDKHDEVVTYVDQSNFKAELVDIDLQELLRKVAKWDAVTVDKLERTMRPDGSYHSDGQNYRLVKLERKAVPIAPGDLESAMYRRAKYDDKFDLVERTDAEGQVASMIFEHPDVNTDEKAAGELGRDILKMILFRFRRDLMA